MPMESSASTVEGAAEAPDVPMESSAPTGEDIAEASDVPMESSAPMREDPPEVSDDAYGEFCSDCWEQTMPWKFRQKLWGYTSNGRLLGGTPL